ncbi:DnaD domain protein [Paenibacillus sp. S-38]|uniref:DnaD domain-containing protein n=1 Tax=Paenibacillus sp. S-38 TaxID=3416710 RepID=UPI003CF93182
MWIESHQELARHPKTKKLARKLRVTVPAAIGHLHLLWWWALDFAPDGNLSRYDREDIAEAAMSEAEADDFIHALTESGWVDEDETSGELRLHDWYDYAGRLLEKREEDRERKRKSRRASKDVRVTSDGQSEDGARTVPNRTVPNNTLPNHTEPTEEDDDPSTSQEQAASEVGAVSDPKASAASAFAQSILDVYVTVFGNLSMPPLISGFIVKLMDKGHPEEFVKELLLEAGESSNGKPNIRFLETIAERWEREGIGTREEAKRKKQQAAKNGRNSARTQRSKPHLPLAGTTQPPKMLTREAFRETRDMARTMDKLAPMTDKEFEDAWTQYETKWRTKHAPAAG